MAFKRYKKAAPGRRAGECSYTPEDMKRVSWCMDKDIKIAVVPNWKGDSSQWQVEIMINGRSNLDPKIYTGKEALEKMYEYYKYYYDKNIQKSE
tara:strand:- start:118 stop:399 length:282 start_codon:yes stop_codon:yes gene_type:complete